MRARPWTVLAVCGAGLVALGLLALRAERGSRDKDAAVGLRPLEEIATDATDAIEAPEPVAPAEVRGALSASGSDLRARLDERPVDLAVRVLVGATPYAGEATLLVWEGAFLADLDVPPVAASADRVVPCAPQDVHALRLDGGRSYGLRAQVGTFATAPQVVHVPDGSATPPPVDLVLEDRVWSFRGRTLAPDGSPGDVPLELLYRAPNGRPRSLNVTLDEAGGFHALAKVLDSSVPQMSIELAGTWRDRRVGARGQAAVGPDGAMHFGVLQLAPVPVLVSGRVHDEQGRPIDKALVRVHRAQDGAHAGATELIAEMRGERFEVRGFTTGVEERLTVERSGFLPHEEPFVGNRRKVVVLRRPYVVQGRVLVDEGVPLDGLEVLVRTESNGREEGRTALLHDGRFGVADMPLGPLRVGVYLEGLLVHQALAMVPLPGERANVLRLDPIDLRGRLRRVAVRASSEADGRILSNARAALRLPSSDPERSTTNRGAWIEAAANDAVELTVVDAPGALVDVWAPHHEVARAVLRGDTLDVALRPSDDEKK